MKHPESNEPEIRIAALAIAGMSCGDCVRHVTKALDGMTGVVHVSVDLPRTKRQSSICQRSWMPQR